MKAPLPIRACVAVAVKLCMNASWYSTTAASCEGVHASGSSAHAAHCGLQCYDVMFRLNGKNLSLLRSMLHASKHRDLIPSVYKQSGHES
jgi:hypothetical protein